MSTTKFPIDTINRIMSLSYQFSMIHVNCNLFDVGFLTKADVIYKRSKAGRRTLLRISPGRSGFVSCQHQFG